MQAEARVLPPWVQAPPEVQAEARVLPPWVQAPRARAKARAWAQVPWA